MTDEGGKYMFLSHNSRDFGQLLNSFFTFSCDILLMNMKKLIKKPNTKFLSVIFNKIYIYSTVQSFWPL